MGKIDINFGDTPIQSPNNVATSATEQNAKPEDTTSLEHKPDVEDVTSKDGDEPDTTTTEKKDKEGEDKPDTSSTGELEAGTQIEFDGNTYTVAENGDLVDADGKVFKPANEVEEWLKSNDTEDSNDAPLSIDLIQKAVGFEVTGEDGKPVEFTNDVDGVNAYIKAVIDSKSAELQQGAINKLYSDNPLLKQFVDYCIVNNGSPIGFGELPDRSGIQLDKENAQQQEYIIRMAAHEFGNKSLNDSYIKYLKDTGGLYDEAAAQLQALIEKDNATREQIQAEAERQRQAEAQSIAAYWKNVNDVITSRNIAGYKIPESFVKEVNGQKVTLTPDDFYDYLYKAKEVDADGNKLTGYQRDLNKLSDADLLNRELIDAWLLFTGGTHKDLINMAVKEREVRKLIVKSKELRSTRTIKVTPPKEKGNLDNILLS